MRLKLTSITLNSTHLENMVEFYKILGLEFNMQNVDKGGKIYRANMGGLELSLIAANASDKKAVPILQLSFAVENLDDVARQLAAVPNAMGLMEPSEMADGKKAILLDPDGHSVELSELKS